MTCISFIPTLNSIIYPWTPNLSESMNMNTTLYYFVLKNLQLYSVFCILCNKRKSKKIFYKVESRRTKECVSADRSNLRGVVFPSLFVSILYILYLSVMWKKKRWRMNRKRNTGYGTVGKSICVWICFWLWLELELLFPSLSLSSLLTFSLYDFWSSDIISNS